MRRAAVVAALTLGLSGAGALAPALASPSPVAAASPSATTPALPPAPPWTPAPEFTPPAGVIAGYDITWTQCSAAAGGYANPLPGGSSARTDRTS